MSGDDGEKTISLEMAKWKNELSVSVSGAADLETCAFLLEKGQTVCVLDS